MPRQRSRPDQLRILHVSEVHWGGVVSLLDHFVTQQLRAGHDVHVLAPESMRRWPGAERHRWAVDRSHPQSVLRAVHQLRHTVAQVRPDVVHLHSFVAGFLGRLPELRAAGQHVPVVYQPHAWSTELLSAPVFSRAVRAAEQRAAAHTNLLVTNCHDEVESGRRLGVRLPFRELGVAVDLDRFHPVTEPERRAARARLGLETENLVLVLGRIARQKGQDQLVSAWERQHPSATVLALVGPGETGRLAGSAPRQWGTSIRVFGESLDVRTWLWAADLLLLPSRYETVGVAVAEAMATGLPVVATAVDGVEEVVTGGCLPAAGCVVPRGDMRALLAAVEQRLSQRHLWCAESRAARARAEMLFRPDVVAARLETAYREAIALCVEGTRR
jgi:glycosyltransferase involved in cell wall biosynthesis